MKWFAVGFLMGLAVLVLSMGFAMSVQAEGEGSPPPAESTPPASDPTPPANPPASDPAPSSDPAPASDTPPATSQENTTTTSDAPSTTSQEEETAPAGDGSIDTDNATAVSGTTNTANTNEAAVPENASSTVSNTNDADVGNTAGSAAESGTNAASSSGGNASVSTGNAVAAANVINVVNTNIVNSYGILAFLNFLFGGGMDFRNFDWSYFFGGPVNSGGSGCNFSSCNSGDASLNVINTNDATVTNTVIVRSNTGDNTATTDGDGNASIATGDAYAAANIFNLINTNLINSNYLLVSFNNFGDMHGDLTLPGADFFSQLLARHSMHPNQTTIENNNSATVNNNVGVTADTGNNGATTSGEGDASVTTGNAQAAATTVNQVNSNFIGGTRVFMLINIIGDWSGSIQGLPEGISWMKTPTGVALVSDSGDFSPLNGGAGAASSGTNSLFNSNTNTATVNNDVQVYALTGANQATAEDGDADIHTGDAYAAANVVNMVNTNVIGQNWIFMIFNIFGNWLGNLSFGRPDLWIGAVAQTGNPTLPDSDVIYKFTVSNNGDLDAHNVLLKAQFPKELLKFDDATSQNNSEYNVWNIGTIAKGQTKEFTYKAKAGNVPRGMSATVPLKATLTADETDNNPLDNTETLSILISAPLPFVGNQPPGPYTPDPEITMTKTVSVSTTTLPASVDYKVTILNTGGPAYNVTLTDKLTDPNKKTIYTRSWKLDTIGTDEEVTLSYSVNYDVHVPAGIYKNTAKIKGQKNNPVSVHAVDMKSMEVTALVELQPGSQVLGAESENATPLPPMCAAYITSFIKPGVSNNNEAQVKRLQFFLRDFEGASLTINGVYDEATIAAVKHFQEKYKDEVLTPWGADNPSGFVYFTTQKKINEIYCQGVSQFPLSKSQSNHILASKGEAKPPFASKKPLDFFSGGTVEWQAFFSPFTTLPPLLPAAPVSSSSSENFFTRLQSFFQEITLQFSIPFAQARSLY